jgi:secreted Zn-dependent insulinase-like peptidase
VEDQLRGNEQLGYVVQSYTINRRGVFGLIVCIVSCVKSPNELAVRIDEFIKNYLPKIDEVEHHRLIGSSAKTNSKK